MVEIAIEVEEIVELEVDPIVTEVLHEKHFTLFWFNCVYFVDNRRNNYNNNNNNNYQRRPYDRPPPPESKEDEMEDIEIRLKGLIIKIGDKVNRYISSFKDDNSFIK